MSLSSFRPTERFTGLADVYARCRPGYPAAAVDFILDRCGLAPGATLVDVGCGTGISSRQFAARGLHVIGIEPNADMRSRAAATPSAASVLPPEYRHGSAEATGLNDASADAVLAAQAFHWFRPDETLREFHRILKPGGGVALMWNERDESDSFTAAYGAVVRTASDAAALEQSRACAGEVLLNHPLFPESEKRIFLNEQILDEDGLLGRAFSVSYAPTEPAVAETFAAALRAVFARYQRDGRVVVRYTTTVYLGRSPLVKRY